MPCLKETVCMCVCVCVCVCVCEPVCVHASVCICAYVCLCDVSGTETADASMHGNEQFAQDFPLF